MTAAFTINIDEPTLTALDNLAVRLERSRDALIREALEDYLEFQAWQVRKIEAGLAAADRGEFATDDEVAAVFAKYGVSR
jgi:predicted transcriptional regulator